MAKKEKAFFGKFVWDFYINQFEQMLHAVENKDNPALELYKADLRTLTFRLQGLARLYRGMHNEKRFQKIKDRFKLLEDLMGSLDYYAVAYIQWSKNKKVPPAVLKWLEAEMQKSETTLSIYIKQEYLLSTKSLKWIHEKINSADWLKDATEFEAIQYCFQEEIFAIADFMAEEKLPFTEMEAQVHELRRKLRWLSIYPQALQGRMQYAVKSKNTSKLKAYQTKEVVASPFNAMPARPVISKDIAMEHFVLMDKSNFLALSFVITALGKIKDEGLYQELMSKALVATKSATATTADAMAHKILGSKKTPAQLLKEASTLIAQFQKDAVLETLLIPA
jgi:hypothetical protein